jgi:predicted amidohydrolase
MPRIALFQSQTGIHPEANADALVAAIEEAVDGGASMLFTPEMSGLLDRDSTRAAPRRFHEEDDPVLAAVAAAAKRHDIWVNLGSLAVRTDHDMLASRA